MREVLGMWIGDAESASYWARILDSLKSRGVEDVFLFAVDGLKGLPQAIQAVYPNSLIQRCIVHQLRNCFKLVPFKDRRAVARDMKPIYQAPTREAAELALDTFEGQWGKRYPGVIRLWRDNWAELSTYYDLPQELRKLIYTTNAVEGFHRMLRKFTKTKTIYPSDDAVRKSVFLSVQEISRNWTMPIRDWGIIMGQLSVFFSDRLPAAS